MSHTFEFRAAINVRAYGTITVEADNLDAAKAAIASDEFQMSKHFSPHGGGDNDYDWNVPCPEIYLESVCVDGNFDDDLDLCEDIADAGTNLRNAASEMLAALRLALAVCETEAELRGGNDTDDYAGGAAGPVAKMIRAAIAKAEGRSDG